MLLVDRHIGYDITERCKLVWLSYTSSLTCIGTLLLRITCTVHWKIYCCEKILNHHLHDENFKLIKYFLQQTNRCVVCKYN